MMGRGSGGRRHYGQGSGGSKSGSAGGSWRKDSISPVFGEAKGTEEAEVTSPMKKGPVQEREAHQSKLMLQFEVESESAAPGKGEGGELVVSGAGLGVGAPGAGIAGSGDGGGNMAMQVDVAQVPPIRVEGDNKDLHKVANGKFRRQMRPQGPSQSMGAVEIGGKRLLSQVAGCDLGGEAKKMKMVSKENGVQEEMIAELSEQLCGPK